MDVALFGNSISGLSCWGHLWGRTLLVWPISVLGVQPSLGFLPIGTGNLV